MNKLFAAGNRYLRQMDLRDMALLKLCVGSIGLLAGLGVPKGKRARAGALAGLLAAVTLIPLLAGFFRAILNTDGQA